MPKRNKIAKYAGITLFLSNFACCAGGKTFHNHDNLPLILTYDTMLPNIRLNITEEKNSTKINEIINTLEHVPDNIQLYCNTNGGIIEIFGGPMNNHPLSSLKKSKNCDGFYDFEAKTAVVSANIEAIIQDRENDLDEGYTALHEYGHMVDHLLDYPSNSKSFVNLFGKSLLQKRNFFSKLIFKPTGVNWHRSKEYFADYFSTYYYSKDTREVLKRFNPEIHKFFEELEKSIPQLQ